MKEQFKLAVLYMAGTLLIAMLCVVAAHRYDDQRKQDEAAEEYQALCKEVKRLRQDVSVLRTEGALQRERLDALAARVGKLGDVGKLSDIYRRFEHWEKFGVLPNRR